MTQITGMPASELFGLAAGMLRESLRFSIGRTAEDAIRRTMAEARYMWDIGQQGSQPPSLINAVGALALGQLALIRDVYSNSGPMTLGSDQHLEYAAQVADEHSLDMSGEPR